jgi:trans-aconitate methyltransferase
MLWNKIAKLYEEKFMDLDIYDESYDFFCDQIEKENVEILELACGPGNITRYMLRQKPHWQFTATDYAEEMIKLAQVNNPQAKCELMGMLDIREKKSAMTASFAALDYPMFNHTNSKSSFIKSHNI